MKRWINSFFILKFSFLYQLSLSYPIAAQIVTDTTLPNDSSVTTQSSTQIINGGTRAGNNLFHSFEQFSLSTGHTAYFNNALDVQNMNLSH